ncbi:hypothetical protein CHH67_19565 [Paenibacillus campinasensis]|uniref:VWFA domain-containing protein n=2 Tax=Paenibacillus campinasensis TaxID=66347 RepID=A0A268EKK3_9BACL|nr:hypothetical protein CHH67_19565 [Paenibacillus campinasensis]
MPGQPSQSHISLINNHKRRRVMNKKSIALLLLSFVLLISGVPVQPASASSASYVTATKSLNPSSILVGGETEVTLNIQGTPPVNVVKPNDVLLVIDRSGSMGTEKMNAAKSAAKGFIDLMDLTQHRVGIVDYSSDVRSYDLTTDAAGAKSYIDTLFANGGTATGDAINVSTELLANHRDEAQPVIVLLTDGEATGTGDGLNAFDYALKKANEAKDAGIVFYTIALLNVGDNPDNSAPNNLLKNMATTSHHHHFVLGSVGLSAIYEAIVQEIGLASAYDVVVKDVVAPGFEIVPDSYLNNIPKPEVVGNTLTWRFLELKDDTLTFTYSIRQKPGGKNGTFPVTTTESVITYKDYTGSSKTYRIPTANLEVTYLPPVIDSITPDKGLTAGGEPVTITGANFRANAKVMFGTKFATNVVVVNENEITATTPDGTQGMTQVKVINDDSQSDTIDFAYYAIPEITSITPTNGPISGNTNVKIYGKNFMNGVKVKFGDRYVTSLTYYNSGYLYLQTPATDTWGAVDVVIENPDGTTTVLEDGFFYDEPPKLTLTDVAPNEGLTTGDEIVVLTGMEFKAGAKVFFGDIESPSVTVNSASRLTVKTPVAPEGTVDVKVVNTDGAESVLSQAFTFLPPPPPNPPQITAVSPNSGRLDESTLVYVDGKDFVSGAVVYFDENEVSTSYLSDTRLRFRTPIGNEVKSVAIKVVNPDGQSDVLEDAFSYLPPPEKPDPVINGVTPANGPMAGGTLIYVDGANYQQGIQLFMVRDGVETPLSADYLSSSRLRLRTPAVNAPGAVDFKVVNPDMKEATLLSAFTYDPPPVIPAPTVSLISPSVGNTKGGNIVEITGENFQRNATVSFGGYTVGLHTFVSDTKIRVRAPEVTTAGIVDVTVTNPDGQFFTVNNGYTFEELQPIITNVSPSNGPLAGGTLVYVDGMYLEPSLTVTFNGNVINYDYLSATRVRFRTPAGTAPGPVDIVITNPNGNSATSQFTYDAPPPVPAPTLRALSPTSGPVNGGTLLYVDGSNFVSGAKVHIDGVEYSADLLSATRLRLRTPRANAPGAVEVRVVNPDGQQSGALYFEYR